MTSVIEYQYIGCQLNYRGQNSNRTLISDLPNLWRLIYDIAVAAIKLLTGRVTS